MDIVMKKAPALVAAKDRKNAVEFKNRFRRQKVKVPGLGTRVVVLEQDPPAGEFVAPGTEVVLRVGSAGRMPVDGFDLSDRFLTKWKGKRVADVLTDLEKQQGDIYKLVQTHDEWSHLDTREKGVLATAIASYLGLKQGSMEAEALEKVVEAAYADLRFLWDIGR
jgi:hypothetical protein